MVKRGRAEDLGIRAREGRLRGSRRGQRLLLRERIAGKMELTSGPGWSVKGDGDMSWAGRAALAREGAGLSAGGWAAALASWAKVGWAGLG